VRQREKSDPEANQMKDCDEGKGLSRSREEKKKAGLTQNGNAWQKRVSTGEVG